jgi:hypothetical protein
VLTFPEMCERAGSLHARVKHQRIVLVVVYSWRSKQHKTQQTFRKAHGHTIDPLSLKNLSTDLKFSVSSNYEVHLPGASLFGVVMVLKKIWARGSREARVDKEGINSLRPD